MTHPPTTEAEEPTIDWLIDQLAPNPGNSPLIDFNKQRLRNLIQLETAKAVREALEGYADLADKEYSWSEVDNWIFAFGDIARSDLIKRRQAV